MAREAAGVNGAGLLPIQASTGAVRTDTLFFGLLAFSGVICAVVFGLVTLFAIRYRRGAKGVRHGKLPEVLNRQVEVGWTVGTLFLAFFLFWWAASAQLGSLIPPEGALEIHVVGKQWMWKVQHPSGAREIDALHAPLGRPVRLVMTSQDTIHDFYVPAFRMKQDVLPGRYTQEWFQATRLGTFPIECAEYCGTDHARMGGEVVIMTPSDYARWSAAQPNANGLANQGAQAYLRLGCAACHGGGGAPAVQGPSLVGVFGAPVRLADGRTVTADEAFLRAMLVTPERQPLAGWPAAMPSYAKAADEEEIVELVAYLRSMSVHPGAAT